ncbi:MAG: sporulation initiation inhibitor Soj [Clostridiales bacterium]|nr:MAG: sporulation initiation inhibitor Soj [Clostridiales bacterium]
MAKVISVFNQKGGVGKTTVSINIAAGLSRKNKSVLLLDIDPQSNCSSGINSIEIENGIYELLSGEVGIDEVIINVKKNLDLLPSTSDLAALPLEISDETSNYDLLKNSISDISDNYDYIIIDCPPALGILSINALAASDSIIVPIQTEYFALEGVSKLIETIEMIKRGVNQKINIEGVLLNMVDSRNNLSKEVIKQVRSYFGDLVYNTTIPRNVRLAEAPSYSMSIYDYDKISKGARSFKKLIKEILSKEADNG